MKKFIFGLVFFLILIAGLWTVAVPESVLIQLIENSIPGGSYYLKTEGFKKGLFYNFTAEKVYFKKQGIEKTPEDYPSACTDMSARVNLVSLLRLSPALDFACSLGDGKVVGETGLKAKGSVKIKGSGIRISRIPALGPAGLSGDGELSGSLWFRDGEGEINLAVTSLKIRSTSLGGAFLPLEMFHDVRGTMKVKGGTLDVQSFTLEGKGVYARLKGNVKGKHLDMNIELMMDSSFTPSPVLQMMLMSYKVSPGYYVIPFRTDLVL